MDDGTPLHFCMVLCSERHKLRPYIEHGGGILSVKASNNENMIRLVHPGAKVYSEGCVKSSYIMECVEQNRLLNLDDYRLAKDEVYESDSDDLLLHEAHSSHIIKGQLKDKCGRKKYLLSEDMNILRYLINERVCDDARGNEIWKTMGLLKITSHTWQSMRDRYLKYILPNLHTYDLTFREKAMLTGAPVEPPGKQHAFPNKAHETDEENNRINESSGKAKVSYDDLDNALLQAATVSQSHSLEQQQTSPHKQASLRKKSPTKCSSVSKLVTSSQTDLTLDTDEQRLSGLHLRSQDEPKKSLDQSLDGDDSSSAVSPQLFRDSADFTEQNLDKPSPSKTKRQSDDSFSDLDGNNVDGIINRKRLRKRHKQKNDDREKVMPVVNPILRQEPCTSKKRNNEVSQTRSRTLELKTLKTVERWLDLTRSEMIDALYRVNGVLDDAIHWIIYGTRKNGMPVWDETADKLLMMESSQTTKRLLKSYTIQEISHRKVFLSEN